MLKQLMGSTDLTAFINTLEEPQMTKQDIADFSVDNLKGSTKDVATVRLIFVAGGDAATTTLSNRTSNGAYRLFEAKLTVVISSCIDINFLFPGPWEYESCVTALNGTFLSGLYKQHTSAHGQSRNKLRCCFEGKYPRCKTLLRSLSY